jgi:hypothetical protein
LKIIEKTSITEDGDPELEKKRVAYWGQRNDVTFVRKKIAVKERKALQEKVDRLNIIKGFPKVVWDYCTFTPEEYEKKRKKLKVERGYCEIFLPRLYMQEYNVKFNGLYCAYSINGKLPFQEEQFVNCVDRYQRDANREAVFENGERVKYKENIRFEEKEWIFAPGLG